MSGGIGGTLGQWIAFVESGLYAFRDAGANVLKDFAAFGGFKDQTLSEFAVQNSYYYDSKNLDMVGTSRSELLRAILSGLSIPMSMNYSAHNSHLATHPTKAVAESPYGTLPTATADFNLVGDFTILPSTIVRLESQNYNIATFLPNLAVTELGIPLTTTQVTERYANWLGIDTLKEDTDFVRYT